MRIGRHELGLDFYAVLGIRPDATADDVRRAHRRLVLEHHPDRSGADLAAAEERTKAVNVAAAVLVDPAARAAYDDGRRVGADRRVGCSSSGGSRGPIPETGPGEPSRAEPAPAPPPRWGERARPWWIAAIYATGVAGFLVLHHATRSGALTRPMGTLPDATPPAPFVLPRTAVASADGESHRGALRSPRLRGKARTIAAGGGAAARARPVAPRGAADGRPSDGNGVGAALRLRTLADLDRELASAR